MDNQKNTNKQQIGNILFDFYSFNVIEETTGRGVPALMSEIERAAADPVNCKIFSSILRLYWAGRLHEKSNLSLRDAAAEVQALVMSGVNLGEIGKVIMEKVVASGLFDKEESPDPKQQEPAQ